MKSTMILTIIGVGVFVNSAVAYSGHSIEATASEPDPHSLKQMRGAKLIPDVPTGEMVPIEDHKDAVEAKRTDGHHLYGLCLLATMTTVVGAFALVSCGNPIIEKNTWLVLDTVAVVIMACSLFFAVEHLFEDLAGEFPHYVVTLHVVYAIAIFFAASFGAYALRHNAINLASFNAVMFWIVLLAKGGALSATQEQLGASLLDVMIITLASLAFFAVLMVFSDFIKPEKGWYDDVETSLAGGAFAGGLVTMVGMLINGEHSKNHNSTWADTETVMLKNGFAAATCVAAVVLTPFLGRQITASADNKWLCRFWHFVNDVVGILPYFTVSVGLGNAVCNHFGIAPDRKMAHVVNAFMGGLAGLAMILVVAFTPFLQKKNDETKNLAGLMLGFGGYIAGAGWSGLMVGAMTELPEGRGYNDEREHRYTMCIILLCNAVLMPVYVIYLKPVVTKKTSE